MLYAGRLPSLNCYNAPIKALMPGGDQPSFFFSELGQRPLYCMLSCSTRQKQDPCADRESREFFDGSLCLDASSKTSRRTVVGWFSKGARVRR